MLLLCPDTTTGQMQSGCIAVCDGLGPVRVGEDKRQGTADGDQVSSSSSSNTQGTPDSDDVALRGWLVRVAGASSGPAATVTICVTVNQFEIRAYGFGFKQTTTPVLPGM